MKHLLMKVKHIAMMIMMVLCLTVMSGQMEITTQAYTQEEKEAAKAWLSANGYSPDMAGAQAAYADYMNGKFGAIPGLPEPNVTQPPQEQQPQEQQPQEQSPQQQPPKEQPEEKEPEGDNSEEGEPQHGQEGGEVSDPQSTTEPASQETPSEPDKEAAEGLKDLVDSVELPEGVDELVLPTPSQQEFADMIDVFVSGFSESEQEEIKKAKERLERQKQERAQAEREAEGVPQVEHKPQKNIIMILCAVLLVAVIGLGVVIIKKNSEK